MPFNRQPILSTLQFPYHQMPGGPIPFIDNIDGRIGRKLQAELDWKLYDFSRIHQFVYAEIYRINTSMDSFVEEHPNLYEFHEDPFDDSEVPKTRIREAIYSQNMENERVTSFVDQITIVGLWAIAEQFLASIYREYRGVLDGVSSDSIESPYRWNDLVQAYNGLGIDLTTCENFANANECRVLNNAIKHDPVVKRPLASFPYFDEYSGKSLFAVPLEMQRYFNGVSDLLGSLIARCNDRLSPPDAATQE